MPDVQPAKLPTAPGSRPLRVMFVITSLEVGGAETLLVNMMRQFDPARIQPSVTCLKHAGVLGKQISDDFSVHSELIRGKFDTRVLGRLKKLMQGSGIDAVITVGAGDKMFWGRLAARRAGVPAILSALHSTGWPDGVGRLNRMLTPVTDAFIAVAEPHRRYLIDQEGFPGRKVFLVPNGVDTEHFVVDQQAAQNWRQRFGIPATSPVCGIVAALRPEKNHELFFEVAAATLQSLPDCHFLVVGDGAERNRLQQLAQSMPCADRLHLAGNSDDVRGALSAMDLFALTSHNEASPVSILEAMSAGLPVVAPRVGSIDQAVLDGQTGYLVAPGVRSEFVRRWCELLADRQKARQFGSAGRQHVVRYGSLHSMTAGYTELIETICWRKMSRRAGEVLATPATPVPTVIPATPSQQ
ncbi:MAG: glycosyltransferase [Pirellulaceae bacterium]